MLININLYSLVLVFMGLTIAMLLVNGVRDWAGIVGITIVVGFVSFVAMFALAHFGFISFY